jgi:fructose-specific phosphotransferase system IIA component
MLTEVIERDLIISELRAKDKEGIIKEMASKFGQSGVIKNEDSFIKVIEAREQIESTAIGGGIAIPHARSDAVEKLVVALGRSSKGVDFASLDGKPVHLIFMIGCPSGETKTYLQVLARIARLCKNKKMREGLMKAKDVDVILCFLKGFDVGSDRPEPVRLKDGRMIYPDINNEK